MISYAHACNKICVVNSLWCMFIAKFVVNSLSLFVWSSFKLRNVLGIAYYYSSVVILRKLL
jgi:hypothetical protein